MEKTKKILIVEDEVVIAMDLQASIEKFGYKVTNHVTRGEDVIRAIDSKRPDIVLMDIKLEGKLDGLETAQIVYENYDIPVIFITSYSNADIIERAKKTNPFGYIVKPFDDRELLTNIEIAIYKHEVELKLRESERKYRELSESIQQIIIECDLNGSIKYINQPGLQLLGLSFSEYEAGVSLNSFITNNSFEFIKERIVNHSLKDAQGISREHLLVSKYGKHYFIEEYLSPVYTDNVKVGFRGILFDITSKRLKETLSALYNKLTFLYDEDFADPIEIIKYLIFEFKKQFFYIEDVYFNENKNDEGKFLTHKDRTFTERKYGSGHSEFVIEHKKPIYLRGKELEAFNKKNKIKIYGKKAACWCGFPLNFQNRNFGVFALQSFKNENALTLGDFENLSNFFNNVNALFERISYLKYVKQSEAEYKHLVDSINEGLIQLDLKGNVTFVNRQLTEITGYSDIELIGKNLLNSLKFNSETRVKLKKEMFGRKQGQSNQYELHIVSKSGKPKDLIINGSPFKNNLGEIIGAIATVVDVTEKKEYLRLIRDSEQKFKAIFEQAAVGVAIVHSSTGFLHSVNKKYCEILGYTKEALRNMNFMQITHPEDLAEDQDKMKKILTGEINEFSLEKRLFKKNLEIVWVNLTVSPLWAKGEEPTNHIAIIEDITSRKKVEAGLIKSEMEKENILRSMPDSFMVVGRDGQIINSYFNQNERIIIPENRKRINDYNIRDVFENSLFQNFIQNISNCLETSRVEFIEIELETDQLANWFEIRFSPINADFALMLIRNVTSLKKSILEIQKFYNITEQTHELIMITDKRGRIEYVNPMFSMVTGYKLAELKGKTPSLFKTNKHQRKFYDELWSAINSGQSFKGEFVNLKKNGEMFIEEKIISPVLNNAGEIINFISTGRDVTEDRKKEKRLQTYQKFEKTLEKKENKYRTLSLIQGQEKERVRIAREIHDGLGQMLTVANANLEGLDTSDVKEKEKRIKLHIVKEMVAEIIQESRRISHNLSPVGLYEFGLHAILLQFIKRIQNNNSVDIKFNSNIEGVRFKIEVEINLYRILQEGMQNALKHSKAKKIFINIKFENNQLRLNIKDNGIGFNVNQFAVSNQHLNGIRNIEERAKIIDGTLNFKSMKGKGFEIELILKAKKVNL